jgi:hypothetical protein
MKGFTKEEMKVLKKHFDADSRLKTLWEKSLPYQDVRGDGRHAENVVYFTAKLIEHEKDAEPQVALPAAIIHDIGWYWMTPQEHRDGLPYGTPKSRKSTRNSGSRKVVSCSRNRDTQQKR